MQQLTGSRCARKRRTGHFCTCYVCGAAVYPQPLEVDIDPEDFALRLPRGYAEMAVVEDERTRQLELQARLYCRMCASPAVIRQNERAMSDFNRNASTRFEGTSQPEHDAHRRPYF